MLACFDKYEFFLNDTPTQSFNLNYREGKCLTHKPARPHLCLPWYLHFKYFNRNIAKIAFGTNVPLVLF